MSIQIRVQRKKASLNVLSDYTGEGWVIDSPVAGPQPRKVVRKVNSLETNDQKQILPPDELVKRRPILPHLQSDYENAKTKLK